MSSHTPEPGGSSPGHAPGLHATPASGSAAPVDLAVQIDADPDAVWEALSTAPGLERWFPLKADLVPGPGGSIGLWWGPGVGGTARLAHWEEGRRIGWIEAHGEGVEVSVDFLIEARAGPTLVRVVQSGFQGEDWDDVLDTLHSGWRYFLFNLKHALERHRQRARHMVWSRGRSRVPRSSLWKAILEDGGLLPAEGPGEIGSSARLWSGHTARLVQVTPGIHLAALVPALSDALLFIELEPGRDTFHLGVWLSLYGPEGQEMEQLQSGLDKVMTGLLG